MKNNPITINDEEYILTETKKNKELYFWHYNFSKITDINLVCYYYQKYITQKILNGEIFEGFNDIIFTPTLDNRFIKITMYSFKKKTKYKLHNLKAQTIVLIYFNLLM